MSNADYSYAVAYSPASVAAAKTFVPSFKQLVADYNVRYVRFQLADPTNQVRYRVLPAASFAKILESKRPSVTILQGILGIAFLSLAEGFSPAEEYLLAPDLSTLKILPYKPGFASLTGFLQYKTPHPGLDGKLSFDVPNDPRTVLKRVVDRAHAQRIDFLVGFEIEFILLTSVRPIKTVHDMQAYTNALALPLGSVQEKVLEELADTVQAAGIEVLMYHPEAAPGQYEFITGPLPPLQAADALVFTQQAVYDVASKHGLRATLAPRLHSYSCGSGLHTHVSVHSKSDPPKVAGQLSPTESSFLAGLLQHLRACCAFSLPLPASYSRVLDGVFSGGTYVTWGTDSREVPVRLAHSLSPSSRNFEIKCLDGTASPHLAIAAFLGAGLKGIEEKAKLTVGDCQGTPAAFRDENGRKELGITQRMPLKWEEARDSLRADKVMEEVLGGNDVITKYLAANENLAKQLEAPSDEGEKLSLLVENY